MQVRYALIFFITLILTFKVKLYNYNSSPSISFFQPLPYTPFPSLSNSWPLFLNCCYPQACILLYIEIQPALSLQSYLLICDHTLIVLIKKERTCPPWAVPYPGWDPGLFKCTNVLSRSMPSSALFSTMDSGILVTSNVLSSPSLQSTFSQQQKKYLTHANLCHHYRKVGTSSRKNYDYKSRLKLYKWRVNYESQVYDHCQTYKTAQTLLFFPHPFWDRLEDESEINNFSSHTPLFLCCTILLVAILCYDITDTI